MMLQQPSHNKMSKISLLLLFYLAILGHGHKVKKEQSLAWRNYYEPDTNKAQNWNYVNRGYQSPYVPKLNEPKGYSNLYYGSNSISKPAADQIARYKMKQKAPSVSYGSYYSPNANNYQNGSPRNQGYEWNQNKQSSVDNSKYFPPVLKTQVPASSAQPSSSSAQKFGDKGYDWNQNRQSSVDSSKYFPPAQKNTLPQKGYSHLYYDSNAVSKPAADQGNEWNQNKQSSVDNSKYFPPVLKTQVPASSAQPSSSSAQKFGDKGYDWNQNRQSSVDNSKYFPPVQKNTLPQKGYSHLYYDSNAVSKPAADQVSFGGNHNSKVLNSRVKAHQQWPSKNGDPRYGQQSLGYLNYYSHRKRNTGVKTTVSTTTSSPNSTPGFIVELFHEYIIGNTSTSTSENELQI